MLTVGENSMDILKRYGKILDGKFYAKNIPCTRISKGFGDFMIGGMGEAGGRGETVIVENEKCLKC